MDNEELKKFIEEIEKNKSSRVDEKIAEKKSKMWDKLPPTSLPSGELVINTSLVDDPEIIFSIPEKSRDVEDKNGKFGIRKTETKWEIYDVSSGEVIKESTSYSKFFDGNDWDPGQSEMGVNLFTASKKFPINLHENIDGTIKSVKDLSYKYPQISKIQWQQFESMKGGYFQVILDFTIRKDVNLIVWSFSIDGSPYKIMEGIQPTENKIGLEYRWNSEKFQSLKSGSILSISIRTNKPKLRGDLQDPGEVVLAEGLSGSSGLGGRDQLETVLTYQVK
jgi:hypothetical protein